MEVNLLILISINNVSTIINTDGSKFVNFNHEKNNFYSFNQDNN